MKLLMTSGATREPIDEVRFITNFSSGNTGAFLADYFTDQKHDVTVLLGLGAQKPRYARNIINFTSFSDLDSKMNRLLSANKFDGVIHLAAVSDYTISSIETSGKAFVPNELKKIDSGEDLTLKLKRNHKIVNQIKKYSGPNGPLVVAFKLTNSTSYTEQITAIHKLSLSEGVDCVVHNDFNDIKDGKENRFKIFEKDKVRFESLDRQMMAAEIELLIRDHL